jgi:hypothetical protein
MSEHRDAEIAEVVIVLDQTCSQDLPAAVQRMKDVGLELTETDEQSLTVGGTVDASRLAALQKLDCVKYVRVSMTYIADYPPGDPRDKDGVESDD